MKDWQVEESSDPDNQWQLLETEQELPNELTLEETVAPVQDWQPVEYAETEPSGGRNWILPSFIILAMIAVVAYIAFLGLNGVDFLPLTAAVTEPAVPPQEPDVTVEAAEEAAVVVTTESPTVTPEPAPTATLPPTPAPLLTPALVEQRYATIDSQYGLNARSSPAADAEVVEVLDDGAKYAVSGEQDGRLEIVLEDGRKVWVSKDFVIESTEQIPREDAVGLPPAVEAPQGEDLAVEAPTDDPATTDPPTETTGITPPEPFTDLVPFGEALLVLVEGGVNARTAGSIDSDIILTIPQGAALSALGQSADGEWLRIELPNGAIAWVFKDTVETRGAIDSLPVVDPNAEETEPESAEETPAEETVAPIADTEAITSTAPITTTTPISEATSPVETAIEAVDPEIAVGLIGVKARALPELGAEVAEILGSGTVLSVTGRTADSAWVAVTLEGGDVAWVFVGTVDLNVEPSTLPVVEP